MTPPSSTVRAHVTEVVARCISSGRGPADVIAEMPQVRSGGASHRAAVVGWALRVLGARLRLERALGDALPRRDDERARALSLATMVEAGAAPGPWCAGLPDQAAMTAAVDAIEDPTQRLAARAGAPLWVARRFVDDYGDAAEAALLALGASPPRTVRVNLLRGGRDQLRDALREEGVETEPGRFAPTALHCQGDADLFATRAYRDGWFEQQDEASQLAVLATAPPPKGRVLDLCAGSGGKTLGIAAAMQNRGAVTAADVHAGRLRALRGRLARAGADNVRPQLLGRDGADVFAPVDAFARRCDRILVDAPCSGTGSWRRRPQARAAVQETDLDDLVQTQRRLLEQAAAWLQPGARLVYATCSLLRDENEAQVQWLRERCPELEVVRLAEVLGGAVAAPITDATGTFLQLRPDLHGCDGFFAAVLRRPRPQRS